MKGHMKPTMKQHLLLLTALLVGCNTLSRTPTPPSVQPTNLYEVEFTRVSDKNPEARVLAVPALKGEFQKQVLNEINSGLSFSKLSTQTFTVESQNKRYVQATFKVTNNTGRTLNGLTFIPVNTDDTDGNAGNNATTPTVGSTPFKAVTYFDKTDASSKASSLIPGNAQIYRPSTDTTETDADASPYRTGIDTSALDIQPPAGLSIGDVKDYGWEVTGSLANGATGIVTFSVSFDMAAESRQDPYGFNLLVAFADDPDETGITRIASIQGNGTASPLVGQTVTIDGVVTADFQSSTELKGFFVQEETSQQDADPATSEGIFVSCDTTCFDVAVGNRVQVTGTVVENFNQTQLGTVTSVVKMSNNAALPAPVTVTLPIDDVANWERLEGMRLSVSGVVTDNYLLGRGGSVRIADARIWNFTQANTPDATGYSNFLSDFARRTLTIDDGKLAQNADPVFGRNGLPLSASNTLRGGDTAVVTGVLGYGFEGWSGSADRYRVHATQSSFTGAARPAAPAEVGGSFKVAAMNVLNFFNGNGSGAGFPTSRGATTFVEFEKQRDKIVEALIGLDADVIGLLEIENDYDQAIPAIQTLIDAINSHPNVQGTYAFVNPVSKVGTDEISVGMIYRSNKVTPVGNFAVLDSSFNPLYIDTRNRPTWARTFRDNSTGGIFTAVMAHLKSKGSGCGAGDDDTTTGQGNCNKTRTDAATVMMDWLATNPTGVADSDYILMGDLNSYRMEDPIQAILKGADNTLSTSDDFVNLFSATSYSYQFDGQWGSLDHGLASGSLASQVTGQAKWNINSDEPTVLDYNTEFKSASQITNFYAKTPYRSSDHDPLKVGLNLTADTAPASSIDVRVSGNLELNDGQNGTVRVGSLGSNYTGDVTLSASITGGTGITVTFPEGNTASASGSKAVKVDVPAGTTAGTYTVTVTGTGSGGETDTVTFTVKVTASVVVGPQPWINEIHYDNTGADSGEAIEVVVPDAYTPTDLKVVLYNGGDGKAYGTPTTPTFVKSVGAYKIYTVTYPSNGIQNGGPDGVALCDGSTVLQFLSYEGAFKAVDGCAINVNSTNIGVSEAGTEALGNSLRLSGTGSKYSDFTWNAPALATFGDVNTDQTLQ